MICKNCGAEIEDGSYFCTCCGERTDSDGEEMIYSGETEMLDDSADLTVPLNDAEEFGDPFNDAVPVSEETAYDETSEPTAPTEADEDNGELTEADEETAEDEAADAQDVPEAEETADVLPAEKKTSAVARFTQNNAGMTTAVLILSVALLAVIGFLLIDKLFALNASSARASTIRIISQSEDVSVKAGTPTKFFVDAEGTNLTYQWYIKKSGDQMWIIWKNHDKAETSAKANDSWDGMQVYCMITDNNRTALASDIITITIVKE